MRSALPPLATKRQTISRSVKIPRRRLSSHTGMQPTLDARIFRAASRIGSEGCTHSIGTDINSFTFIAILSVKVGERVTEGQRVPRHAGQGRGSKQDAMFGSWL